MIIDRKETATASGTRMRIAHITTVPQTLFFLRGQTKFLREAGFEVHAVSSPGAELEMFARDEGAIVHSLRIRRAITPLHDLTVLARLTALFRRLRPQLVHAHTPKAGLLAMIAAVFAHVPARIYQIHGLPFVTATGPRRILLKYAERVACALAHEVLCVSRSMLQICIEERICEPRKLRVLGFGSINGVDAKERFSPDRVRHLRDEKRRRLGIPLDALVVGFVGRLVRDKGIVELERAFAAVKTSFPHAHLLLVGQPEMQDPIPQQTWKRLHNNPDIHLVGQDWDVAPWYAAMDVLALPTYREGFVVVALEAAAMELPVVGTSVPGCRDAIDDGVTGTLVAPRDAEALRNGIARYFSDAGLRRDHGNAGRARVLRDFVPESLWEAQCEVYRRHVHRETRKAPELSESRLTCAPEPLRAKRVAVIGGSAPSLINFRGAMLASMVAAGHSVRAYAPEDDPSVRTALRQIGVEFETYSLSRTSTNPIDDIVTLRGLTTALRNFSPNIVLSYTAKPVIYGTLAARRVGAQASAIITGAGSILSEPKGLRGGFNAFVLRKLYRTALRRCEVIFFQNPDDEALFRTIGCIGATQVVHRIEGSGVDLDYFASTPLPTGPLTFLMSARLLYDKGVREFVEAARCVRKNYPDVRFRLLGGFDTNPSAIGPAEVAGWTEEGVVEYMGTAEDVRPHIAAAHVCVLPSYSEGMPRALLEGMSMGRPLIATDVPGCRETVIPGENGFLVPARDARALAKAMHLLLSHPSQLPALGLRSREIAEARFDVHVVNRLILDALELSCPGQSQ